MLYEISTFEEKQYGSQKYNIYEETDMSEVQSRVKCPQCGYEQADYIYDCRTSDGDTMCRRCGYQEYSETKFDEDGNYCGSKHEISRGAGALWYRRIGQGVRCGEFFNTGKEVLDAERRLREGLDKGLIDPDVFYLTRWKRETKQVEVVIGKFYEWPESEGDKSKGEVAPPATPTDWDDFPPF